MTCFVSGKFRLIKIFWYSFGIDRLAANGTSGVAVAETTVSLGVTAGLVAVGLAVGDEQEERDDETINRSGK